MTNYIGQIINNYQLIRLLGHGSYAEVYLGEHTKNKEYVAVKLLHAYIADDVIKEQFISEAHFIAELKHPRIVQLIDIGFDVTTPFLIMNYVPKGNLRHLYPKGLILPSEVIIRYTKQIASALQYAHDKNIVHCDIKPENILLDNEDNLVISDFGIAHIAQSTRVQTTHTPEGTPMYMAPEQFRGKPRLESDQYALGVVIYEWLCGEPPFKGKTFPELMEQHLHATPRPLQSKISDISTKVDAVVQKALAKNPKKRYKSIQEFADALEEALLSTQQTAWSNNIIIKPIIFSQRALFSKRNVTRRTIVTGLLLLIGGITTDLAWQTRSQWLYIFNNPSSPSSAALESNLRSSTIQINRGGLLNDDQTSINEVKTQVKNISFLQGRKAGLVSVIVPAISNNAQDTQQAINICNKIYNILKTMSNEESAFANAIFAGPGYTEQSSYAKINSAELDIYLFR